MLLYEVLAIYPELIEEFMVEEYYKRRGRKDVWDVWDSEILQVLWPKVMLAAAASHLTLIVDGLDRCKDDMSLFFECLMKCKQSPPFGFFKLLLVSDNGKMVHKYSSAAGFATYRITRQDTQEDIKATVQAVMEPIANYRDYSPRIKDMICDKIPEGANGMYLWARIMVDEVTRALLSESKLEEKLNSLPKGLNRLYDSILGRFQRNKDQKDFVKSVLFWAVFHYEVINSEELQIGIALRVKNTLKPGTDVFNENVMLQSDIRNEVAYTCGHLVKFSGNILILVHKSLKEFLITPKHRGVKYHKMYFFEEKHSHGIISDLCTTYLLQSCFKNAGIRFDPKNPEWKKKICARLEEHKFVAYAALGWETHAKFSGKPFPANNKNHRVLLNHQKQEAICWVEVWWYLRYWKAWRRGNSGCEVYLHQVLGLTTNRNPLGGNRHSALCCFICF